MINDTGVNGIILRKFIFHVDSIRYTRCWLTYVVELKGYLVILLCVYATHTVYFLLLHLK